MGLAKISLGSGYDSLGIWLGVPKDLAKTFHDLAGIPKGYGEELLIICSGFLGSARDLARLVRISQGSDLGFLKVWLGDPEARIPS